MEAFKVCEKETKTKAYSKDGLAREEKMDPEAMARAETRDWVQEFLGTFNEQIDAIEADIESLSSSKRSKRADIDEKELLLTRHRWHVTKLEHVTRLIDNEQIAASDVNEVKDDIEYYLEAAIEDPDFMDTNGDDDIYEPLDLDNASSSSFVTTSSTKKSSTEAAPADSTTKTDSPVKPKKSVAAAGGLDGLLKGVGTKSKKGSMQQASDSSKSTATAAARLPGSVAAAASGLGTQARSANAPGLGGSGPGGGSMAAMLKQREAGQQAAALQAQQTQMAQQQLVQQKGQQAPPPPPPQQMLMMQQQQQQMQQSLQQPVSSSRAPPQQLQMQQPGQQQAMGAGGLGDLGAGIRPASLNDGGPFGGGLGASREGADASANADARRQVLSLLESGIDNVPDLHDSERPKQYLPRNPYNTAAEFPVQPSPLFENAAVFERFDTDTLFFVFYYQQGTYQQYLAARELKKQSWRYHKKYMTWFQRHDQPKVTTDEFEQGTYVYFDYETGWCQRIKSEFTFEYSFLEDELNVPSGGSTAGAGASGAGVAAGASSGVGAGVGVGVGVGKS
jgi:CCR4-NOT transcription complex subunit 3